MEIITLLNNKTLKPADKTAIISNHILTGKFTHQELINLANKLSNPDKANIIEAFEYATKKQADIGSQELFDFVAENLSSIAPRVRWESAKVIGNIAPFFTEQLGKAVPQLLKNAFDSGTVVRWSAGYALGEIIKLDTELNREILPHIEEIIKKEEKPSIQKFYEKAIAMIS
mgnify:CR=1 FL=1